MLLKELLKNTSFLYRKNTEKEDLEILSLEVDSRKVTAGSLFVALDGLKEKGEAFVPEALKRGALVVASERELSLENRLNLVSKNLRKDLAVMAKNFYQASDEKLAMYGVTGTNGKTSTTFFLKEIFGRTGKQTGYLSSISKGWGEEREEVSHTTPDPLSLHAFLNKGAKKGFEVCVLEASSHGIHQARVHGIRFRCRILTNLCSDHLDYHENLENYRKVKHDFLMNSEDLCVVNLDDALGQVIAQKKPKGKVLTYSLSDSKATLFADEVRNSEEGMLCFLCYEGKRELLLLPHVVGRHNVENLLAASLSALSSGVSWDTLLEVIPRLKLPLGRLTRMDFPSVQVYIDYAHNEDGLEKCLLALKPKTENRLRLLFGCGGERDKGKRALMGKVASKWADALYLTSDNPRSEDSGAILNDIRKGIDCPQKIVWEGEERKAGIEKIIEDTENGDVSVIAGKGHETYQEVRGEYHPFSDFEVATSAWKKRENKRNEDSHV